MKFTKQRLKEIVKEEMKRLTEEQYLNCDEVNLEMPHNKRYDEMSEEELLVVMCRASHYKPYYFAMYELENRLGYKGPFPAPKG